MLLIFPPGWAPFSPFLALPQLKGFLNSNNLDAEIIDENINFFDTIISSDYLQKKIVDSRIRWEELNCLSKRSKEEQEDFTILTKILVIENEIEKIDLIKNRYRNGESFSQTEIDDIFGIATSIVETQYQNYRITSTGIMNKKYKNNSISALRSYLEDSKNNLYLDFFTQNSNILEKAKDYSNIGISITGESQLQSALILTKLLRERYGKNKKIFLGGNFITRIANYYPEKLDFFLEHVDFISIGDGEYTLKSLLENEHINKIPNIVFKNERNEIEFTDVKYFDLKKLVIPNFDGFNLKKYFSSKLVLPIFTSRSCYSKCSFCTIAKGTTGPYRAYLIEEILELVKQLQKKYYCDFFCFVDETFNIERMIKFSNEIIKNELKFYWFTETRFDRLFTEKETKMLYEAGCRKMQFGIESYNQSILNSMNKNIDIDIIMPSIINFIKNGIGVHLFFMVGFPGETLENIENTFQFIEKISTNADPMLVTQGFGTFGLEIGSPIQKNPTKFKLNILTDYKQDDFIGLGLSYEVLENTITPEEAILIVSNRKKNNEDKFLFFDKSLFSEIQNFLELSLSINSKNSRLIKSQKILELKNGFINKSDCKFILMNLSTQKIKLFDNPKMVPMLSDKNSDIILEEDELKFKKFKINPFITWDELEGDMILRNNLNSEKFKINFETFAEILKFRKSRKLNMKNKDYLNLNRIILKNNIIY